MKKKIIEAELVTKELEAELGMVAPAKRAVGRPRKERIFTPVGFWDNKEYVRGKLSERERKFVLHYVKFSSVVRACEEVGISRAAGTRYLRRPWVLRYIEHLRDRAAKAADLTMDKVGAVMNGAVSGDPSITPLQIQAATAAAKFLRPAGPVGVHIGTLNQQNNTHYTGVSPFAELDQSGMLEKIKQNLLETDADDE